MVRGAGVIFFAYIGFDAVSTAAQEAKNPQRDMPIGMLGSLGICTMLYIAVSLVLTGIVNYTQLNVPAPIAVAIRRSARRSPGSNIHQDRRHRRALVGDSGDAARPAAHFLHDVEGRLAAAGFQRRASAIPDAVACANYHRRGRHAGRRAFSHRPAGRTGFHRHAAGVCHRLRRRVCPALHRPGNPRPFRTPAFWLVAPLGVASCGYSDVADLPADTWARLIVWMAIGMVIYFLYSRRHSEVQQARRRNKHARQNQANLEFRLRKNK